jgi:hypothetical protein
VKLKAITYYGRLKASVTAIKSVASVSLLARIVAAVQQGNFVNFLQAFEEMSIQDEYLVSFYKTLTDDAGVAEHAALLTAKAFADIGVTTDDEFMAFTKNLNDTPVLTDDEVFAVGKLLQNTSAVLEAHALGHSKTLTSSVSFTDDLDGTASILDDQELAVFKQRTNIASAADLFSRQVGYSRAFSDSSSTTDTGLLLKQGYTDAPYYFAEDYVGSSHSFS